jgi:hypothetical protein
MLSISSSFLKIVVSEGHGVVRSDATKSALIVRIPVADCYRFAQGVGAILNAVTFAGQKRQVTNVRPFRVSIKRRGLFRSDKPVTGV